MHRRKTQISRYTLCNPEHQTPPGALNESSGEISELPEARSGEDTAEKFTPEDPLPQARSAEDPAEKFNSRGSAPEDPLNRKGLDLWDEGYECAGIIAINSSALSR